MIWKPTLLWSLGLCVIGYYLYTPLPDGITEPWKLRCLLALFRVVRIFPYICEKVGYGEPLHINRMVTSWIFKLAAEPVTSESLEIHDMKIEGVEVRIYRPKSLDKSGAPGLAFYHGGGFIVFDIDTYDNVVRKLSLEAGIVIMSVNYRRSPEHPFPVPLDDCVKTTVYFINNAREFGVDPKRIGVAGDSAGGNLAAATARKLTYQLSGDINQPIKFQVLIYPILQAFDLRLPSFITETDTMPEILCTELVASAWLQYWSGVFDKTYYHFMANKHTSLNLKKSKLTTYVSSSLLPDKYQTKIQKPQSESEIITDETLSNNFEKTLLNPYYCPLLADDVSKLPPALILTTEYDVLRDDGLLYVRRLKNAGVDVSHVHIGNGYHGIFSFTRFQIGKDFMKAVANYIKGRLK